MGLYGYLQDFVPRSVKFDDADSKAATCPNRVLPYRRVILLWSFGVTFCQVPQAEDGSSRLVQT